MNALSLDQIAHAVVSAFPNLSEQEQRVALALYRLLANGESVNAEQISGASDVPREAVAEMLPKWPGVQRSADGAVTGFWGLTLSKTKHLFRVDGRELHTWCAWDTLFLPALLGAAADVESVCPETSQRIRLTIDPSGVQSVEPKSVALSFLLPTKAEIERSVTETFCCHVQFFASSEAAGQWVSRHPRTFVLPLEMAWQVGMRRNTTQFRAVQSEHFVDAVQRYRQGGEQCVS
jgi:alkylmercury lyase